MSDAIDTRDTRDMSGEDVREARGRLGELWGVGRPLHLSELGRALRLAGRDPGNTVMRWEQGDTPSGPASVALAMMLAGAVPPDPLSRILRAPRVAEPPAAPSTYKVGDVFEIEGDGPAVLAGDEEHGYILAPLYDVTRAVSRRHQSIDALAAKLPAYRATWTDDVHRDDVALALALVRLADGDAAAVEDIARIGLPVTHRRSFEKVFAGLADRLVFHLERARAPLPDPSEGDVAAAAAAEAANARRYEDALRAVMQARLWPA